MLRRVEALEFSGRVGAPFTFLRDESRAPAAILVGALNTYRRSGRTHGSAGGAPTGAAEAAALPTLSTDGDTAYMCL